MYLYLCCAALFPSLYCFFLASTVLHIHMFPLKTSSSVIIIIVVICLFVVCL
ncbi:hypothetical protein BDB00DRAFT_860778 [Zychaea mexicana]|uniref:uncharacterized protein n=1 Tax=Zychaea mexicana TaxID=64656 RepID=UPI0022FE2642|nr:uncharacterized protein BDB00DRAFT_860778 [Zychaea mexicana]KAI9472945.1 hypothetical protein BDB00DRAFT_860778 [Zychaea mexicana]